MIMREEERWIIMGGLPLRLPVRVEPQGRMSSDGEPLPFLTIIRNDMISISKESLINVVCNSANNIILVMIMREKERWIIMGGLPLRLPIRVEPQGRISSDGEPLPSLTIIRNYMISISKVSLINAVC